MLEPVQSKRDRKEKSQNGCESFVVAKLRQFECGLGFVHLMYNFLEIVRKFIEFMLPSRSIAWGNGQQLLPVRAQSPLMQVRPRRGRWNSMDPSRTGCPRYLNSSSRTSLRIPFR